MMTTTQRVLDGKMLSINWKRIAIVHMLFYLAITRAHLEDPQYDESIYQQGNFALNTGQYIKREFHYSPEKDSWQRKFAETISKAIEEDTKGSDYSNSNSDDLHHFHKDTSETGNDYENPSSPGHTYISPPVDPHVSVTREDSTCSNESFTQQPGNHEVKTGVVNVASSHPDHQYSHNEKGEILIHRPAPIIVNRPPTKVVVSHPPLIVKPAPVIFHRPPSVIVRQVFVKPRPEPAKMQPVFVKVIKPPPEKIFIKDHISCGDCHMNPDCPSKQHHRHYKCPYQYSMS